MKILMLSIFIVIGFVSLLIFGIMYGSPKNYEISDQTTTLSSQLNELIKLEYEGATIIHIFGVEKSVYSVGEEIKITPELVNIGNKSITIVHADPMSFATIYDQNGNKVWSYPHLVQDIGFTTTLNPQQHYYWDPKKIQERYNIKINSPGIYKIESYAEFNVLNSSERKHFQIFSNPIEIIVK